MAAYADTHCHLNLNSFQIDLPAVIDRARQAGVEHFLVPGINLETSLEAVRISEIYPEIYAAVGIHPNDAETWDRGSLDQLKILSRHPKVVAIGEIGLDFYRNPGIKEQQFQVLHQQLGLAKQVGKPVILHSRHAMTELWETIQDWHDELIRESSMLAACPGVFHAYEGDVFTAQAAQERCFFIGIGGSITYKNPQERKQVVMDIPLEFLVSETDAPFLSPVPHRGERNEPANIPLIVAKTAELHKMTLELTARIMNENAEKLLKWRTPA